MTEICDRGSPGRRPGDPVRAPGPLGAGARQPLRHARARRAGHGRERRRLAGSGALREVANPRLLAFLKEPEPPKGLKDAWEKLPIFTSRCSTCRPKTVSSAPCQQVVRRAARWTSPPADPALLAGRRGAADHLGPGRHPRPPQEAPEPGIYRQQVLGPNKVIMRWLAHRGGRAGLPGSTRRPTRASPSRWRWCWLRSGDDPRRGTKTPVPDSSLSEYQFAGLRGGPRPSW